MSPRIQTTTTIDGRFVSPREAHISVFDNALLYAEGLFETLLVVDDRVVFFKEHMDRLKSGVKVTGLRLPVGIDKLERWMIKTVRAHPGRIKKLRLTITSGESARWLGEQGKPRIILSVAEHTMPEQPYSLLTSPFRIDQDSVFRRVKTISYAINAAAFKQAEEKGYDDALLLNEDGQVAETTSSNIYWVEDGTICTPPLSSGCLDGVTRRVFLREVNRLKLPFVEKNCTLGCLSQAKEVMMTSSLKLVVGVSRIRSGRRVFRFSPGPATERLSAHLRRLAGI